MYRQHFGIKAAPLGGEQSELWDDGALVGLNERFQWLLQSPGLGLLTGEAGVGKTAALRHLTQGLNPHRYQTLYLAETDFGRTDLYRSLAMALGLEPACRRAQLWRDLKTHIQELADHKQLLLVWIIDEAQNLPSEFFRDLPAFLNFAFDSRELMTVWLVGHPSLAHTQSRALCGPGRTHPGLSTTDARHRTRTICRADYPCTQSRRLPAHPAGRFRHGVATAGIARPTETGRTDPENRAADGRSQRPESSSR